MIGSEDPEYQVTEEEIVRRAGRDVHVRPAARRAAADSRPATTSSRRCSSAEVDGESLSDMDFNLFFLLLSVAGNETTRNAISHGMNAFLEHPDQCELFAVDIDGHAGRGHRGDPAVGHPGAVLPAQRHPRRGAARPDRSRRATRSPSGTSPATGTRTCSTIRSRSTSPATPNPHIAFGGGGPHFCLGAQLARMEIHVLFEELAQRVHHVEALGPPGSPTVQLHRRDQAPPGPVSPLLVRGRAGGVHLEEGSP